MAHLLDLGSLAGPLVLTQDPGVFRDDTRSGRGKSSGAAISGVLPLGAMN